MNFPIPKRDKAPKDVTPKSTGLKDLSKKRSSSSSSGKSKQPLRSKSPSKSQEDEQERKEQSADKESDEEEKTEKRILELNSDKKKDDESDITTYSEFSRSSDESELKRSKSSKNSPTIKQTIVQANIIPEVYLKDLTYTQIKALQTFVELKKSLGQPFGLSKLIRPDVKQIITESFVAFEVTNATKWLTWSHELLFEQLINLSGGEANVSSIQEKFDNTKAKVLKVCKDFAHHPMKPVSYLGFIQSMVEIPRTCETDRMSETENKSLVELAIKNLGMQTDGRFKDAINEIRAELLSFKSRITDLAIFRVEFMRIHTRISK